MTIPNPANTIVKNPQNKKNVVIRFCNIHQKWKK
jgi:desulfoferrodoxin (superoxide reductase-like protein)